MNVTTTIYVAFSYSKWVSLIWQFCFRSIVMYMELIWLNTNEKSVLATGCRNEMFIQNGKLFPQWRIKLFWKFVLLLSPRGIYWGVVECFLFSFPLFKLELFFFSLIKLLLIDWYHKATRHFINFFFLYYIISHSFARKKIFIL